VDFTRTDGRRVTSIDLRGAVGPLSQQLDKSIKMIARDAKTPDFLDGLFAAIVLAAAGEKMPAGFTALVVGGTNDEGALTKYTRTISIPKQAEARTYLTDLACDLLRDPNDYFLPIEAVEKVVKIEGEFTEGAVERAIDEIRDKKDQKCRSDFGPVRNAREFRAPVAEIKGGLIARRFGPLMGMFVRNRKGKKSRADD
jgi:hypothetical protein